MTHSKCQNTARCYPFYVPQHYFHPKSLQDDSLIAYDIYTRRKLCCKIIAVSFSHHTPSALTTPTICLWNTCGFNFWLPQLLSTYTLFPDSCHVYGRAPKQILLMYEAMMLFWSYLKMHFSNVKSNILVCKWSNILCKYCVIMSRISHRVGLTVFTGCRFRQRCLEQT